MIVADSKNLRIVLEGAMKERWERLIDKKKISQQEAMEALVAFLLEQDDLCQSVVLGQLQPTPDLLRVIFERIGKRGSPRGIILDEPEQRGRKTG